MYYFIIVYNFFLSEGHMQDIFEKVDTTYQTHIKRWLIKN